ncbi:hypothetical protein ACE04B_40725, partial [Rhizobium phaseoli]
MIRLKLGLKNRGNEIACARPGLAPRCLFVEPVMGPQERPRHLRGKPRCLTFAAFADGRFCRRDFGLALRHFGADRR